MSEEEKQAIIHLLDKQARYEYAKNNGLSFKDEDYEAYIIRQSMINKDKEIERLNNIINKTIEFLQREQIEKGEYCDFFIEDKQIKVQDILDKLQELKGDGGNGR